MKFKAFTQAYFLIKYNESYSHSLLKRADAYVGIIFVGGLFLYSFWPMRIYATEKIQ